MHGRSRLPVQADAFFHLAWAHTIGAGRNDMPAQIENIRYTIDAVRTAAAMGCRVFVGTGSQAEYGRVDGVLRADTPTNPENGYGMAKLCAGQMSRTRGPPPWAWIMCGRVSFRFTAAMTAPTR